MDRANAAIMEQLESHQKDIKSLKDDFNKANNKLDRTEDKLDRIERILLQRGGSSNEDLFLKAEKAI